MSVASAAEITGLLQAWGAGDAAALERLAPLIYGDLRRMARRQMQRERSGDTLQATALVHEAFLRLAGVKNVRWQDRAHFFAIAGQMMRRILVEAARARGAAKRGGSAVCVNLDESIDAIPARLSVYTPRNSEGQLPRNGTSTRRSQRRFVARRSRC